MRTSSLRIFSLCLVCFLLACTSKDDPSDVIGSRRVESDACDFGTSTAPGPFCGVSIFALMSNPERYYGKDVYTYGYLGVSKGGDMSLSYEALPRPLPDFFSCIDLGTPKLRLSEGVYSVAIFGRFAASPNNICAGRIEAPVIDTVERN